MLVVVKVDDLDPLKVSQDVHLENMGDKKFGRQLTNLEMHNPTNSDLL